MILASEGGSMDGGSKQVTKRSTMDGKYGLGQRKITVKRGHFEGTNPC